MLTVILNPIQYFINDLTKNPTLKTSIIYLSIFITYPTKETFHRLIETQCLFKKKLSTYAHLCTHTQTLQYNQITDPPGEGGG